MSGHCSVNFSFFFTGVAFDENFESWDTVWDRYKSATRFTERVRLRKALTSTLIIPKLESLVNEMSSGYFIDKKEFIKVLEDIAENPRKSSFIWRYIL